MYDVWTGWFLAMCSYPYLYLRVWASEERAWRCGSCYFRANLLHLLGARRKTTLRLALDEIRKVMGKHSMCRCGARRWPGEQPFVHARDRAKEALGSKASEDSRRSKTNEVRF